MVEGNASMYLGSDRMVEMVTGERTTQAMGGARVHCAESGVGHFLCKTEADALDVVRRYQLPANWQGTPPAAAAAQPPLDLAALVPASERQAFDMRRFVKGLLDGGDFFEIQALWARGDDRLRALARSWVSWPTTSSTRERVVRRLGDRFVQLCDAFNVPLVFLSDVRLHGGHRRGEAGHHPPTARITAIAATVPKICVVVRKAYGAGLYAMAGPGFAPTPRSRCRRRRSR